MNGKAFARSEFGFRPLAGVETCRQLNPSQGRDVLARVTSRKGLIFGIGENAVMQPELQTVLMRVKEIPVEDLPRLLGDLEEIRCTAMARLAAPAPVASQSDELLDVDGAARRLGISKDYLYRHHARFPFTRRMGKRLLFSSFGIDCHIKQARQ
jgi:hypothetical protein